MTASMAEANCTFLEANSIFLSRTRDGKSVMNSYNELQEQYANLSTAALAAAKQYCEANDMTSPARNKPAGCNWDGVRSLYRYACDFAKSDASTLALGVVDQSEV